MLWQGEVLPVSWHQNQNFIVQHERRTDYSSDTTNRLGQNYSQNSVKEEGKVLKLSGLIYQRVLYLLTKSNPWDWVYTSPPPFKSVSAPLTVIEHITEILTPPNTIWFLSFFWLDSCCYGDYDCFNYRNNIVQLSTEMLWLINETDIPVTGR
jgi:hypothetical protein